MLLGRLRVRQKLAVLVVPLLLLVVAAAVPLVAGRVAAAERSSDDARAVERAVRIGALVDALQQERVQSLSYIRGTGSREAMVASTETVLELAKRLDRDYGRTDDRLASVLRGVSARTSLGGTRLQVREERATGFSVHLGFTESIDGLISLLGVVERADRTTQVGRQQLALDAIIRRNEAISSAGAGLLVESRLEITPRVLSLVSAGRAIADYQESVFVRLADPVSVALFREVSAGPSSDTLSRYLDQLATSSSGVVEKTVAADLGPQVGRIILASRPVSDRVAAQAVRAADDSAGRDRWLSLVGILVALVLLVGAAVLALFVSRSIARPLRRLTESADEVADVAQQELVRVADTDDPEAAVPQLRPVQVGTTDELGELAQAFNRVQQVAAALVERQLVSRQNVATMFGNVGRRTQNLVGRQLAMIDSLERNEQDPALLDRLYRLDHVSTRLRRNANSLVVLSGALDQQINGEPLSVADTIRSALGEIEGFQRVRLAEVDTAVLTPNVTPDVILLLAELLENGTSFSPPHTEVEVDAQAAAGGEVVIRIVDHGLGMTPEQLAAENGRLVSRERLDLAPTDVLGLFVVGRLARRHGIEVLLAPTPGTGVTAEVRVPARHVVRAEEPAVAAGREDGTRGWWEADGRGGAPAGPVSWAGAPAPRSAPAGPQRVAEPGGRPPGGPAPLPTGPAPQGTPPPAGPGRNGRGPAGDGRDAAPAGRPGPDAEPAGDDATSAGRHVRETTDRHVRETDRNGRDPAGRNGRDAASAGRNGRDAAEPDRNGRDAASAGRNGRDAAEADRNGRDVGSAGRRGHGAGTDDRNGPGAGSAGRADLGAAAGVELGGGEAVAPGAEGAAGAPAGRDTRPGGATRARIRAVPDAPGTHPGGSPAAAPLRALAGIVRRVRGAQLPDTGAPRRPEPATPPPSADEARQSVLDFEAGVQRALRDTGADPAAMSTAADEMPWPALAPGAEGAAGSKALVDEFEDGVRRALARLDEVAGRPAPGPAMLFERRPRAIPSPRRPADGPPPGGREQGDPPARITPRRLDSGATLGRLGLHPADEPASEDQDRGPAAIDEDRSARRRPTADLRDRSAADADPAGPSGPTSDLRDRRVAGAGPAGPVESSADPRDRPAAVAGPAGPADSVADDRPAGPVQGAPAAGGEPGGGGSAEVRPLQRRRRSAEPTPDGGPGNPGSVRRIGTNGLPDRRRAVDPGPSGPEGLADLVRRVPGAQFPAGARGAVPGIPQPGPAAEQDAAAAARAFVEEFEAGVERALRDGGDRRTTGTDEEDAR